MYPVLSNHLEYGMRLKLLQQFYLYSSKSVLSPHSRILIETGLNLITRRSCGKVMFSRVCVKNSVHGGIHPRADIPQADTPQSDSHCSGWYASYWNAFLLVSTYVVCERLSVMQRQARLPEFLTHLARTPYSGISYRTTPPLPRNENLARLQLEYVETNRCIPQGYHLVVVCDAMQDVETWKHFPASIMLQ